MWKPKADSIAISHHLWQITGNVGRDQKNFDRFHVTKASILLMNVYILGYQCFDFFTETE